MSLLSSCAMLARTVLSKLSHRTDTRLWRDYKFPDHWDERTRLIASMIKPGSRVMEFGAGEGKLQRYLDAKCSYVGTDVVARAPGVKVVDLNRSPLPTITDMDVAVFAGVLEYLSDPPAVVKWVGNSFPECIASYECTPHRDPGFARVREVVKRTSWGWANHLEETELLELFAKAGLHCIDKRIWGEPDSGYVFHFRRK